MELQAQYVYAGGATADPATGKMQSEPGIVQIYGYIQQLATFDLMPWYKEPEQFHFSPPREEMLNEEDVLSSTIIRSEVGYAILTVICAPGEKRV